MSKEYRDTLNLPQTDLSMKAGLPKKEPEILAFWDSINLYHKIREQNNGKEQFILHDGPPYANGDIHLGHAVNKTLKDITIKFQSMLGKDAPYVPGWHCHGLPIELNVEKKHGTANNIYSADISMAGKTGTCQTEYWKSSGLYISSFAGYFPAENPKYSCIVVIHKPNKEKGYYGSVVAAPVFKEIAQKIYSESQYLSS